MTSSEKTYNVFLTDGRSEVWNDQMMASGGSKLFELHPDAQVTEDSPYEDGVEYSPNATFNISLADGRQEQWTHDMWKQGGARLRELHPDAQVSVTSPYTRENHEAVSAPQNVPLVDVNKMMAGARKAVAGVQNFVPSFGTAPTIDYSMGEDGKIHATEPQGVVGAVKKEIDYNREAAERDAFFAAHEFVPQLDEEGNQMTDEEGNVVGSWELRSEEDQQRMLAELEEDNARRAEYFGTVSRKEQERISQEYSDLMTQLNALDNGKEDDGKKGIKELEAQIKIDDALVNKALSGETLFGKKEKEAAQRLDKNKAFLETMKSDKQALLDRLYENKVYQNEYANTKAIAEEGSSNLADIVMGIEYMSRPNEYGVSPVAQEYIDKVNGHDIPAVKGAYYFANRAQNALDASKNTDNGFSAFLQGHKDTFSNIDFWRFGLESIIANSGVKSVFDKIASKVNNFSDRELTETDFDNILSDDEKELLRQFVNCSSAEAMRAYDTNNMYGAGVTSAESLGFMAQFILTGGILKGAETAAQKGFAKWLSNAAKRGLSKGVNKELIRAGMGAIKTLEAVSIPAAKAVPMTLMQTGFYKNISENLIRRDQDGNLEFGKVGEDGTIDYNLGGAVGTAYRDAYVETWTEMALSPALEVFGETFGHYAKLGLDKMGAFGGKVEMFATKLDDLYKIVHNSDALSLLRDAAFDGYLEEMGEEVLGAAVQSIWDKEAWSNFWKADNLSSMAVAFAPMSVLGAGVSAANFASRVKKYNESVPAIRAMLLEKSGMSEQEIDEALRRESLNLADVGTKVKSLIAPLLQDGNLTNEQYKQVYNFAVATGEAEVSKALMKGLAADERRDKKAELTETYRDFVNADGKVRYYDTEDGRVMVRTDLPAENGKYFGVTATGDIVWVDANTQLTEMDEQRFLDAEVKADKDRSELARTQQQARENESQFRRALAQNPNVRLIGADGQKHDYTFVGWDVDGTAIVQTTGKNGQPIQEKFTKRAIANALGVDMAILTDDELAERNIAAQRKKNILSRKATSYSGETIAFSGVQSKLIGVRPSENGYTVIADQGGNTVSREVSEEDLQFMLMGFSMKEALGEESAASDVVESANAEEQKLTNEEIAKRYTDANGVVDEVNFLDQEPEAYAQYRDGIKGKENTDNLIKANADAKQTEYEKAKAAMDKETNPAVKDQLEANVNELKAQAERLRSLYEKRTASATSAGALSSAEAQKVRDQYISAGLTEDEIDALAVRNIEDAMKEQESVGEVDATDPEEAIRQKEANENAKADAQARIDYWKSVLASAASAQSQSLENAQLQHRAKMASLTKAMAQAKTEELRNTIASEMIEVDNQFNEQAKKYVDEAVGDLNTANTRVEVCTSLNIAEKMRGCRASAKSINTVARAVQGGAKISGFFDASSNTIYVVADNAKDVADIRETFTHEEQHRKTAAGMLDTKMKDILANAGLKGKLGRQFLENSVRLMSGTTFYNGKDEYELADEFISHVVERAFKNGGNVAGTLANFGIKDENIVNFISNIYNGREESVPQPGGNETGSVSDGTADSGDGSVESAESGAVEGQGSRPAGSGERVRAKVAADPERFISGVEALYNGNNEPVEANGILIADKTDDGNVRFNVRTWEEGGRDILAGYLAKQVAEGKLTQSEADNFLAEMDRLATEARHLADGDPNNLFGQWAWSEVRKKDGTVIPLLHAMKSNAEYDLNIDFSTVCKKRQVINNIFNKMISDGKLLKEKLSDSDIARINQIIQKHGLEIACGICFVDSKRYNAYKFADGFMDKFNPLVQSLVPGQQIAGFNYAEDEAFSNDGKLDLSQVDEVVDWSEVFTPKGDNTKALAKYDLNWSKVYNTLKPLYDKARKNFNGSDAKFVEWWEKNGEGEPTEMDRWNYEVKSVLAHKNAEARMALQISQVPALRKLAKAEDFIASRGWTNIMAQNEELETLWNVQKGAAGARANEDNTQYLNDVLEANVKGDIFDIGGYLMQSFSDFIGRMYFDYYQAFADLAARQLPGHAYTKEPNFVKLFGLMGMKVNMSLVSDVDTKVIEELGKDYAGLTYKDGKLTYNFYETVRDAEGNIVRQGQTFPAEQAFALQADPRYSENCGTIAVGLSKQHILMMLRDKNIRMVIPYHKSGLPHGTALVYNLREVNDYTDVQNTYRKGKPLSSDEKKQAKKRVDNFNFVLHQMSIAEDKVAAYNALRLMHLEHDLASEDKHEVFEQLYNEIVSGQRTEGVVAKELSNRFDSENFIPKVAADIYQEACAKWGYTPKFDEFAGEQGYYKVLIDFAVYNEEGNYTPQRNISFQLPENVNELVAEALAEDESIHAKEMQETEPVIADIEAYLGDRVIRQEQDRIAKKDDKKITDKERDFMRTNIYNVGDPRNALSSATNISSRAIEAAINGEEYVESGVRAKVTEDSGVRFAVKDINRAAQLTAEQANLLVSIMESVAETITTEVYTRERWNAELMGYIQTPFGMVKMSDHQYEKMEAKNRLAEAAMIAPTLRNPDVVIVEPSEAKNDSTTSRTSSLVFVKTFNRNGEKIKFYQSVSMDIDGEEVVNSNHYISSKTQLVKKMLSGRLLINKASLSNSSEWHLAEDLNGLPDLLPTQENDALSTGKGTNNSEINNSEGYTPFKVVNDNQSVFVSNALRAMDKIPMKKGNAQAWMNKLQQAGGLKKEEDKWLGLSQWLQEQKGDITKEDVAQFIAEHQIRIEETHYADDADLSAMDAKYPGFSDAFEMDADMSGEHGLYVSNRSQALKLYEQFGDGSIDVDDMDDYELIEFGLSLMTEDLMGNPINDIRRDYATDGLENKREIALTVPTIQPYKQTDEIHFGDAGQGRAVAWVRFGDVTTKTDNAKVSEAAKAYRDYKSALEEAYVDDFNNGLFNRLSEEERAELARLEKEHEDAYDNNTDKRVLVIDEVQSKRHQDGKEKGYKTATAADASAARAAYDQAFKDAENYAYEMSMKYNVDIADWTGVATDEEYREYKRLYDRYIDLGEKYEETEDAYRRGVPDAPFRENWHELAMKRMLRLAAEEGYDKIAWTNGNMQADRYNLANEVRSIDHGDWYDKDGVEVKSVAINMIYSGQSFDIEVEHDGRVNWSSDTSFEGKNLSDIVGKELASRILSSSTESIEGDGLRIGGEGMRFFYDTKIVNWMNKYGKQWGVKVEDITLPGLQNEEGWHSIDVTEAMKDSVMDGQVMFKATYEVQQEFAPRFAEIKSEYEQKKANIIGHSGRFTPEEWRAHRAELAQIGAERDARMQELNAEYDAAMTAAEEEDRKNAPVYDKVGEANAERGNALFAAAKEQFGTTTDLNEAGYIVPDGEMIDLSGKNNGGEAGHRQNDHRDINSVINDRKYETATEYMEDFINEGAIRIAPEVGLVTLANKPTKEQRDALRSYLYKHSNEGVEVEIYKGSESVATAQYRERTAPSRILGDINEYFDNGVVPAGNVMFKAVDITPEVRAEMDTIIASAKENGTFMKAPNGQDTKLTEDQWAMVRTQNFKNWFGDWENDPENASKVVDENGEPRVVYHGTTWNMMSEMPGDAVFFEEAYFSDATSIASVFGSKVGGFFLNFRNPYDFDAMTSGWASLDPADFPDLDVEIVEDFFDDEEGENVSYTSIGEVYRAAIRKGFDSVIAHNIEDAGGTGVQYVASAPNQVKSATDNNGEFSSEDNDIRFSVAGNGNYTGQFAGKFGYFGPKPANETEASILDYIMMSLNKYLDERMSDKEAISEAIGYAYNEIGTGDAGTENWTDELIDKFTPDMFRSAKQQAYLDKINSPQFKNWFGNSVVVNEDGTPKVVYRGTRDGAVTKFDTTYGTYFTDNAAIADDYAYFDNDYADDEEETRTYDVYLRLENPFVIDCKYNEWKDLPSVVNGIDSGAHSTNGWVKYIKEHPELGYDGIIFKDIIDGYGPSYSEAGTDYVILDPNQAKDAYDNNGEFSRENNDIRFKAEGNEEAAEIYDMYENGTNGIMTMGDVVEMIDANDDLMEDGDLADMVDMYRTLQRQNLREGMRDFAGGEMEDLFNEQILPKLRELAGDALDEDGYIRFRMSRENATFDEQTNELYNDAKTSLRMADEGELALAGDGSLLDARLGGVLFRIIGEEAAERADFKDAGSRIAALAEAKKSDGILSPSRILLATGWYKDAEGNWKFEEEDFGIDDVKIKDGARIADVVSDDLLFAEYPELAEYTLKVGGIKGAGLFNSENKTISISDKYASEAGAKKEHRLTLIHEIQHYIQAKEGWTNGANDEGETIRNAVREAMPNIKYDLNTVLSAVFNGGVANLKRQYASFKKKWGFNPVNFLMTVKKEDYAAYQAYLQNAGEVEARNAETRADMTTEERRASMPSETEDVPADNQWRNEPYENVRFSVKGNITRQGLEKALGEEYGNAMDVIFENLPDAVKDSVSQNAIRLGGNFSQAVAEYYAGLAEKDTLTSEDQALVDLARRVISYYANDVINNHTNETFATNEVLWAMYDQAHRLDESIEDQRKRQEMKRELGKDEAVGGKTSLEDLIAKAEADKEDMKAQYDAFSAILDELKGVRSASRARRTYDRKTVKKVVRLANILLASKMEDVRHSEIQKMLKSITEATGMADITDSVDHLMQMVINHHVRNLENALAKLENSKAVKVTSKKVTEQGSLDVKGQRLLDTYLKHKDIKPEEVSNPEEYSLNVLMQEAIDKMNNGTPEQQENAELDYIALNMVKMYRENVLAHQSEISTLKDALDKADEEYEAQKEKARKELSEKEADKKVRELGKIHREYTESIRRNIATAQMEEAEGLTDLVQAMTDYTKASHQLALNFLKAQKEHAGEIQHNANSDMEGREAPEQRDNTPTFLQRAYKSVISFPFRSLATFDQMLRGFGAKSANGEGYLWNRFMRGWIDCAGREFLGTKECYNILDSKVSEVFGKEMRWSDLYELEEKMPKATVSFLNGDNMEPHELTQGKLLYILLADQMEDGAMKLRKMGITEEAVERIRRQIDPRFLELADWVVNEFLPARKDIYNGVHERLFGAPMASVDNYFPLKIAKGAIDKTVDPGTAGNEPGNPSDITGSIIKRTKNAKALDILNTDAFSVVIEHVQQMEHWAAFAEFNHDLGTLLSYKRFRNQVSNMSNIYGVKEDLWNQFVDVCRVAAGTYKPKTTDMDKSVLTISAGVTAAKVSLRIWTALKQTLSAPAYLAETINPVYFAEGMVKGWGWCMDNIPLFEKRWKSRQAGDHILAASQGKISKLQETAARIGMTPNALVDAFTVSMGTYAIYKARMDKYTKMGYPEEIADKKAKQDAAILYNETQQSSEAAFLSTIQKDRTVLSNMFTIFRNSSMGYTRQVWDAARNINHKLLGGHSYQRQSIAFMQTMLEREGLSPKQAHNAAVKTYNRQTMKDMVRIAVFGFGLPFFWNMATNMLYLLFGDDDDQKEKMVSDIAVKAAAGGWVEGFVAGNYVSDALGAWALGEDMKNTLNPALPVMSDVATMRRKWKNDKIAAMNDLVNIIAQSVTGINPQTLEDMVMASIDACHGDLGLAREAGFWAMRVINAPQSTIEKLYVDEIKLASEDESRDVVALIKRYAEYKTNRAGGALAWAYNDEDKAKQLDKYTNLFEGALSDRTMQGKVDKTFYELTDKYKAMEDHLKILKSAAKDGDEQAIEELRQFYMSDDYAMMRWFNDKADEISNEIMAGIKSDNQDNARMHSDNVDKMVREIYDNYAGNGTTDVYFQQKFDQYTTGVLPMMDMLEKEYRTKFAKETPEYEAWVAKHQDDLDKAADQAKTNSERILELEEEKNKYRTGTPGHYGYPKKWKPQRDAIKAEIDSLKKQGLTESQVIKNIMKEAYSMENYMPEDIYNSPEFQAYISLKTLGTFSGGKYTTKKIQELEQAIEDATDPITKDKYRKRLEHEKVVLGQQIVRMVNGIDDEDDGFEGIPD